MDLLLNFLLQSYSIIKTDILYSGKRRIDTSICDTIPIYHAKAGCSYGKYLPLKRAKK